MHIKGDRNGLIKFADVKGSAREVVMISKDEIMLSTDNFRDLYISKFISDGIISNKSTITEELSVRGNRKKAIQFIKSHLKDCLCFNSGTNGFVVRYNEDAIIEISTHTNTIEFRFHSTFDINDELKQIVLSEFEEISTYVKWVYDAHMSSVSIPIDSTLLPVDEMYPFLKGETLDSYYQRFMESNAGILICIGPPGTGKTGFIRGLLASTESSATITYDNALLSSDRFFADFIDSMCNVLVMEDADLFLSARSDGNDAMSKFLNIGAGLLSIKGKKLIFSTNLPSVRDIDEALLRKGRCFDIPEFNLLTTDEAQQLIKKLDIEDNLDYNKSLHTIADIYADKDISVPVYKSARRGFGFSQ